jgi:hypothetical protein
MKEQRGKVANLQKQMFENESLVKDKDRIQKALTVELQQTLQQHSSEVCELQLIITQTEKQAASDVKKVHDFCEYLREICF